MGYEVFITESFQKTINKICDADKEILNKIYKRLAENPFEGDPIRYKFFREKRIREKRIYFLVYEDLNIVLLVAFGGKKAQEQTIDEIVKLFPEFRKYAEEIKFKLLS